jgi:putative membrane protein
MERTKNINTNPRIYKAIILIFLFHLIGLLGLWSQTLRPLFLQLVPWHLLLMVVIIGYAHSNVNGRFLKFAAIIFIAGFAAEWAGIHKGWLFGNYTYGETLGTKIDGVPLTIGLIWFLLIYSAGVFMQYSRIKYVLIRVIIGAALLVLLDKLIEPVAIRLDYWHWITNTIPDKNYICWFLLSAGMLLVFEAFDFRKQNIVAAVLFIIEFMFFAALYFLLDQPFRLLGII